MVYRFIKKNSKYFGLRWLLSKFNLYPNSYYNFLKERKLDYIHRKHEIYAQIKKTYHETQGIPGYRTMNFFLNLPKQNFNSQDKNNTWCTDFT